MLIHPLHVPKVPFPPLPALCAVKTPLIICIRFSFIFIIFAEQVGPAAREPEFAAT